MKPFYLYMLKCGDGSFYVGHTDNLDERMAQHLLSRGGYTGRRKPLTLVFVDELPSREEALERELQLKGWSRAKKETLVRGDWAAVHRLARSSRSRSRRSARPS